MSQLSQLKAQINQVATNITQTAAAMNSFSSTLQQQIGTISSAIGGTASNEDRQMVDALQQAMQSVKAASVQLNAAAGKARDWVSKA
ncbi:hypothetical protein [Subdoligranulum variabile]|uniref:Uncharacterized protein n=1 Tax=Subdoligranulum variabile DSM 15176 TaxID=411471 RepID=D1PS38_9FIRM|nr:hypothetical protein [Subdoligranulum variabile]EFB74566.1 hypothetical protein SUBVAR_07221 [Subdoligranulum variabile DSM 15176]UWP69529.1 hypothetical protein NQ490_06690 [Subdoligranulum variabile]